MSVPAPVLVTVFVPSKLWKAASLPSVRSACVSIVKLLDVVKPASKVCDRDLHGPHAAVFLIDFDVAVGEVGVAVGDPAKVAGAPDVEFDDAGRLVVLVGDEAVGEFDDAGAVAAAGE